MYNFNLMNNNPMMMNQISNNSGLKGIIKNKHALNTFDQMNNAAKLNNLKNIPTYNNNSFNGFNNFNNPNPQGYNNFNYPNPQGFNSFNNPNQQGYNNFNYPNQLNYNNPMQQSLGNNYLSNSVPNYPMMNPNSFMNPIMNNSQPILNTLATIPVFNNPINESNTLGYANRTKSVTFRPDNQYFKPLTTVQSLDFNNLATENVILKEKLKEIENSKDKENLKGKEKDNSKENDPEADKNNKERKKKKKNNKFKTDSNEITSMDSLSSFENNNNHNNMKSPEPFKKITRNNQIKLPIKNNDLEISEINLNNKIIKISRDIKQNYESNNLSRIIPINEEIVEPSFLNKKSPAWYDEMVNSERIVSKNQEIQTEINTERIFSVRKNQEIQTEINTERIFSVRKNQAIQTDNDNLNKSFNDYIRPSDSIGIQVEEDHKSTLSEMRFDIFNRNIHLNDKKQSDLKKEIEEFEKRLDKNKTFWDYLNYNNKTHANVIKDNSPRLIAKRSHENEFYKYIDRKNSANNNFMWQIDEFKK